MADVLPDAADAPFVVTLDVGTSSLRAQVYDARARSIHGCAEQKQYQARTTADGGVEFDVPELERLATEALDGILGKMGVKANQVGAVAMSTIWHSLLGVDDTHTPITPLFTWADTRSEAAVDELKREVDEAEVHRRTGCVLHTSYFPAKLRWLRQTRRSTWDRAWRWLSFGEYLYLRLFGDSTCSISMASGTGLLDQHDRQWDSELLRTLDLPEDRLSRLVDLDHPARGLRPKFAKRWPALANVPWYPAVGDGAASNVGCGCTTPERIALMVGTSAAMRIAWPASDVDVPDGVWCYRIDASRFVLGGALSNGGNLLSWLQQTVKIISLEEAEQHIAKAEPDSHGLTVLPFIAGERSPNWTGHAHAAFVGLSLHHTPVDIVQASLEAVAYQVALMYELLRPVARHAKEIVASGGALLNSPSWVQMMSDVLGQPVTVSGEAEASSRGVAALALERLGVIASVDDLPSAFGTTYTPQADRHERYQAARDRQAILYDLLVRHRWDLASPSVSRS